MRFDMRTNKEMIFEYAKALIIRGGGVGLTFLINIVLARKFGANQAGGYYTLYNMLVLLSSLAFMGMGYAVVHYISPLAAGGGRTQTRDYLISYSVIKTLVCSLLMCVITIINCNQFSSYFVKREDGTMFVVAIALLIVPYNTVLLLSEILKAYRLPNNSIFCTNIVGNMCFLLGLLLVKRIDLYCVMRSFFVSQILSLTVSVIIVINCTRNSEIDWVCLLKRIDKEIWNDRETRSFVKEDVSMSIVALSNIILTVFDTLVISHSLKSQDVAVYNIANKVVSIGSIILTTVNSLIGYKIADLAYQKDLKGLRGLLVQYTRIMAGLAVIYVVVCAAFAKLIPVFFGISYCDAVSYTYLLMIGQVVSIITGPCSYFLIMTGETKTYQWIVVVSAIITIIGNSILVKKYGVLGVIVTTIATLCYKNIYGFYKANKSVNLKISDYGRKRE